MEHLLHRAWNEYEHRLYEKLEWNIMTSAMDALDETVAAINDSLDPEEVDHVREKLEEYSEDLWPRILERALAMMASTGQDIEASGEASVALNRSLVESE